MTRTMAQFYFYATFSRLLRKPTKSKTGFLFFYSKIFRTNHLTHHQLNVTSVTSTPHTLTNAHRPWACRGMPFDDVCQIAPQGANVFARWSGRSPHLICERGRRVLLRAYMTKNSLSGEGAGYGQLLN